MSWQALLLETQLLTRAVDGLMSPPPVRKNTAAKALTAFAAVLSVAGLGALAVGAFFWLSEVYPLHIVMTILGGAVLGLAVVAGLCAWLAYNSRFLNAKLRQKVIQSKLKDLSEAVGDEFSGAIRDYPKTTAALAALLGIAVGTIIMKNKGLTLHDIMGDLKDVVRDAKEKADLAIHHLDSSVH